MRITIKAKLAATFATVVALSAGSMLIAIQNLGNLNDSLNNIVNVRTANALTIMEIQGSLESMGSRTRALVLTSDAAEAQGMVASIQEDVDEVNTSLVRLRANADPSNYGTIDSFEKEFNEFHDAAKLAEQHGLIKSDVLALAISRSEGSETLGRVEETMTALKSALATKVEAGDISAFPAYQRATDMFLTMSDMFRQQRNVLLASMDTELQDRWHADYQSGLEAISTSLPILRRAIPASEAALFAAVESATGGSEVKTSTAAPARCPDSSDASRAASSIVPPRATFKIREPGFIWDNSASPIIPRVDAIKGV